MLVATMPACQGSSTQSLRQATVWEVRAGSPQLLDHPLRLDQSVYRFLRSQSNGICVVRILANGP
jgi:hypothetical protein